MKTRDRILRAALTLFNESGEARASLSQIAAELDISEGNLWYHFRTKRDLVTALLDELEVRTDEDLARLRDDGGGIAAYNDFTRRCFSTMWEYRFLFRMRFDRAKERELAERRAAATAKSAHEIERIFTEMARAKLIRGTPAELAALATTASIIARYWLDYLQERYGLVQLAEADLEAGVRQIFALCRPYLTEAALAQVAAASVRRSKTAV
jgi:AcrR family transcriptional regulator